MPSQASIRRSAVVISVSVAFGLPTATVAQTPSSPPGEFDALAAVALMNEVPEAIRTSCVPVEPAAEGAVASAECQHGDQLLLYMRFADVPSLESSYALVLGASGLARDSGPGCAQGPSEGEYTPVDGGTGGRLVCQVGTQASAIAGWSDVDRLVLGLLERPGAEDWVGLHNAWQAAQLVAATVAPAEPVSSQAPPRSPDPMTSPGASLQQWASAATASSQYGETEWSAAQATGPADTTVYGDRQTAWAPAKRDASIEWLELSYDTPVVPSEVVIWETSANGFVTSVELWDGASWVLVWSGQDQSPPFVVGFSPELTPIDFATDRVRVTIDTAVDGWNEIDAVALVGTMPQTAP